MADLTFFRRRGALTLANLAAAANVSLPANADASRSFDDVAPLDTATSVDISFFDNTKYLAQFTQTKAGACFVREKYAEKAPKGLILLLTEDPYRAYALTAQAFYPNAPHEHSIHPSAIVHSTADINANCTVGAGAVIEKNVSLAENVSIGANSVICEGVQIGKNTSIAPNSTISHAIIGADCIIHRGVNIGQDGFGFALSGKGHVKVPQLGRVIIENNVEIGAGTCIDRGAGPDTLIGAGTKIDNLVQIAHNVQIGKGCVIAAQTGIAGSARIGNGVIMGGQVGVSGHLNVGDGAILAAKTGVSGNLEGGKTYGSTPATSINDWHRQTVALNRLIRKKPTT